MPSIAVIGAGQAGAALVARLRALGHDGPLTLIGEEPVPPYQRPPLSKGYLTGDVPAERLYLRPASFYRDNDVRVLTGTRVNAIDPRERRLDLDDETLHYDMLALTTGARPRLLPARIGGALNGVFAMRSLADAQALRPEMAPGRRVLIVGGGYIGLEAAAVCAKLGLEVTIVEAADRILQRVACRETADLFRDLHGAHGVTVREGVSVTALVGEGRISAAQLSDETRIETDFAIVGIGVIPETGLADAAGLSVIDGIAVDARGRSSAPGIWAAGDCASFPRHGDRIRLESVQNAIDHAECVAADMLGDGYDYAPVPWFWSDQYDVKLQIAGLGAGHDRIVRRTESDGAVSHWYFRDDRFLAVDAVNAPRAYMVGKRLLEAGRNPDEARLADPASDLKQLLA